MIVIDQDDIGKSETQLLMDLIFESAGIRVPEQKIRYGKPQEMDVRPDLSDDPNTFIPVTIDTDYDDRFPPGSNSGLLYRRRELSTYFPVENYAIYTQLNVVRLYDILDQINLHLPYPLIEMDLLNQSITTTGLTSITLRANPNSFIWIGNVTINVTIERGDKLLLLSQLELEGF